MALASDYVIGVAPGLSAGGAGVSADLIANRALILSWVVGAVAVALTFFLHVRAGSPDRIRLGVRRGGSSGSHRHGRGWRAAPVVYDVSATVGRALMTKQKPHTDKVQSLNGSGDEVTDGADGETPVDGVKTKLFAVVVPLASPRWWPSCCSAS